MKHLITKDLIQGFAAILLIATLGFIGVRFVWRGDDRARWNKGKCPICGHDFEYEYKLANEDEDFPYVYKCELCDYETQLHYKK